MGASAQYAKRLTLTLTLTLWGWGVPEEPQHTSLRDSPGKSGLLPKPELWKPGRKKGNGSVTDRSVLAKTAKADGCREMPAFRPRRLLAMPL